jgi:hypothetical protein
MKGMICIHCSTANDILDEVIGTCRRCGGELFPEINEGEMK